MNTIFTTDRLFAAPSTTNPLAQTAHCSITDDHDNLVAKAHDRSGPGRWVARAVGNARNSRYEWDLLDSSGNRVLDIVKPRQSLKGPSAEVVTADGSPIGSAVSTKRLNFRGNIAFRGPDDSPVGELVWALGERRSYPILMYRICNQNHTEVGDISIQASGGPWGFHVSFAPAAELRVRALSIAFTLCLIQQRTSVSAS